MEQRVSLQTNGSKKICVNVRNVIYIKAARSYCDVVIADGGKLRTIKQSLSASAFSLKLPKDQFLRVHRSYVVNMQYISAITKKRSGGILELKRFEIKIPFSQSNHKAIRDVIR